MSYNTRSLVQLSGSCPNILIFTYTKPEKTHNQSLRKTLKSSFISHVGRLLLKPGKLDFCGNDVIAIIFDNWPKLMNKCSY